jgi:hypothetical protein
MCGSREGHRESSVLRLVGKYMASVFDFSKEPTVLVVQRAQVDQSDQSARVGR